MARTFNGTTDFMRVASALGVTAPPFTFHARFRNANTTANGTIMAVSDGSNDAHYMIYRGATANDPLGAASNDQGVASGEGQVETFATQSWHVGIAYYGSDTSRQAHRGRIQVYAGGLDQTTLVTPDAMSEWNIGRYSSVVGSYFTGDISHAAIWSAALSVDELKSLAVGFSPRRIRPQSLVFYAPLIRDVYDYKGGATITLTGAATVADEGHTFGR
jgi:hypothetical protein